MTKVVVACVILSFACVSRAAEPRIQSVSGTFVDDGTITISGSAFGSGPTVTLFENFDDGGTVDEQADLAAAHGTRWTSTSWDVRGLRYNDDGISGNRSGRGGCDEQNTGILVHRKNFPPAHEFFLSYWMKWPTGWRFVDAGDINCLPVSRTGPPDPSRSGTSMPLCETFLPGTPENPGTQANHKIVWIEDSRKSGTDDDLIIPMFRGYDMAYGTGNDIGGTRLWPFDYRDPERNWLHHGRWIRMSFYARADPDDEDGDGQPDLNTASGRKWVQMLNEHPDQPVNHWTDQRWGNAEFIDTNNASGDADPPEEWNVFIITGYQDRCQTAVRYLFDDIYLATGDNAFARIEIGNSETYEDCRKLFVAIPQSWSSDTIAASLQIGNFVDEEKAYVFVTTADGERNSVGQEIVIGAQSGAGDGGDSDGALDGGSDAAGTGDAQAFADGASTGGTTVTGCGCHAVEAHAAGGWVLLLAGLAWARRRVFLSGSA